MGLTGEKPNENTTISISKGAYYGNLKSKTLNEIESNVTDLMVS
jgi:hypothetical protein